jgi:hypothetical protein
MSTFMDRGLRKSMNSVTLVGDREGSFPGGSPHKAVPNIPSNYWGGQQKPKRDPRMSL